MDSEDQQLQFDYLKNAFLQAPALIAILRGKDHVFQLANPVFLKTTGLTDEIIGKPVRQVLPELKEQGLLNMLDEVLTTNQPASGEELLVRLDRGRNGILVDGFFDFLCQPIYAACGTPEGIFVHAVEVTEQVAARRKAEELAAELQAVFESLPEGLYLSDLRGNRRFNTVAARIMGYDRPEDVPQTLPDLHKKIHPRYLDGTPIQPEATGLHQAFAGKKTMLECLITDLKTGEDRLVRVLSAPVRDTQGAIIGAVSVSTDITKSAKLQEKVHRHSLRQKLLSQKTSLLRRQNIELKNLNKSKDEFIALASHQLRTPATGVKQFIGMVLDGYVGEIAPEQRVFLQKAYQSNERQLSTINDLLQIAQIDANKVVLHKTKIDVRVLVEAAIAEQQGNMRRREQKIAFNIPNKAVFVQADELRLRMVVDNLLDNASKYSPVGKTITITIATDADWVNISITDEGVGIAEADLPRLFHKFSRIDNPLSIAVGGNGLGLYLAKRIVDAHGGNICVVSQQQAGTTFTVALPCGND